MPNCGMYAPPAAETVTSMGFFRVHKFSMLSISISVPGFLAVFAAVAYFRREGSWAPDTTAYQVVTAAGTLCLVLSFVTALAALIKERSKLSILAFVLSILNFFLYAR